MMLCHVKIKLQSSLTPDLSWPRLSASTLSAPVSAVYLSDSLSTETWPSIQHQEGTCHSSISPSDKTPHSRTELRNPGRRDIRTDSVAGLALGRRLTIYGQQNGTLTLSLPYLSLSVPTLLSPQWLAKRSPKSGNCRGQGTRRRVVCCQEFTHPVGCTPSSEVDRHAGIGCLIRTWCTTGPATSVKYASRSTLSRDNLWRRS